MKARVKGTTDIIDVEFNADALNACYPPYHDKEHDMFYQPEQLEWVDNEVNTEPDYWTRLEHQYAGMAMQGIISRHNVEWDAVVNWSVELATALVQKLKSSDL